MKEPKVFEAFLQAAAQPAVDYVCKSVKDGDITEAHRVIQDEGFTAKQSKTIVAYLESELNMKVDLFGSDTTNDEVYMSIDGQEIRVADYPGLEKKLKDVCRTYYQTHIRMYTP